MNTHAHDTHRRTGTHIRAQAYTRTYAHIHTRTRKRMIQIYLNENDKLTNNNKKVCS